MSAVATSDLEYLARASENSYHQSRADDGIVEGLESADPSWWMLAVQWHPEELTATSEDWDRRLFAAFAKAVRTNRGNVRV